MLKMLTKGNKVGLAAAAVASAAAAKKTLKQPAAATKKRARAPVPSDDFEEEEEEEEAAPVVATNRRKMPVRAAAPVPRTQAFSDDSDDDDLFNSDEEEEANKKAATPKKKVVAAPAAAVDTKPRSKPKSRLEDWEEGSEGGYSDDDRGDLQESRDIGRYGVGKGVRASQSQSQYDSDDDRGYRRRDREPDVEEEDTSGPAELEDYQRLQVRRVFIEKWLHEPYFERAVIHQFARIYIGQNPTNDTPIYRMCEIVGIGKRGSYKLSDSGIVTDKALILAIGSSQQTKKLDAVSNSRISQVELQRYLDDVKASEAKKGNLNPKILTKKAATRAREYATKVLREHKYTDAEIKALIQQRSGHNTFLTTEYTTAREKLLEKIEKEQSKMTASQFDDEDGGSSGAAAESAALVLKMQRELERMEKNYDSHRIKLEAEASKQMMLNKRNKGGNKANDIVASIKRAEKDLTKDTDAEVSKAANDPFRRRETLPSIIWNTSSASSGSFTSENKSKTKEEIQKEMTEAKAVMEAKRAAADAAAIATGIKNAASSSEYNLFVDTDMDTVSEVWCV